jgi:hypothetical protein
MAIAAISHSPPPVLPNPDRSPPGGAETRVSAKPGSAMIAKDNPTNSMIGTQPRPTYIFIYTISFNAGHLVWLCRQISNIIADMSKRRNQTNKYKQYERTHRKIST